MDNFKLTFDGIIDAYRRIDYNFGESCGNRYTFGFSLNFEGIRYCFNFGWFTNTEDVKNVLNRDLKQVSNDDFDSVALELCEDYILTKLYECSCLEEFEQVTESELQIDFE